MAYARITFRTHAVLRMFERRITMGEVLQVVAAGQIIEDYPEDKPYPSHLLLGLINARPIHVVSADNHDDQETIVITAYEPDPAVGSKLSNEDQDMKCVICKLGETREGTTTVAFERESVTLVIKGVPARVCDNCGEEYVDASVAESLLEQAEAAASRGVHLEVREYAAV